MSSTIRILLVEDDPGDARLIEEAMNEAQQGAMEFLRAESLQEMEAMDDPVDAILLDLVLPDSRGIETVQSVRAARPDSPIVVLSGLDDRESALDAIRAGAQDYLVKGDVDAGTLSRTIHYAIERRKMETNPIQKARPESKLLHEVRDDSARIRAVVVDQKDRRTAIFELVRQSSASGQVVLITFDRPYTVWQRRFKDEHVEGVKFIEVIQRDGSDDPDAICLSSPKLLEAVSLKLKGWQKRLGPVHVVVDSLNIVAMYNNLAATSAFAAAMAANSRMGTNHLDFVVIDTQMGEHLIENVTGSIDQVLKWQES